MQITFANSANANVDQQYRLEVIVDDRIRDAAGNLQDTDLVAAGTQPTANGGKANQATPPSNPPTIIPATDGFDPYGTLVSGASGYNVFNVVSNSRPLFISTINDAAAVSANDVSVAEGAATLLLNASNGNISVADPDDNGAATMSATLTVSKGSITAVGGRGGTVSGIGSTTITITGASEAQLNSRLKAVTVTYPDAPGAPTSADWNGSFTVTVVVNDGGNTGVRPTTITGDTNDTTANPGDFDYADAVSA